MESRQANGTQETEVKSQEAASDRGERFNTLLGIMIAVVTVVGALVAWRSALAATEAGNEDDAGIIAALNVQETGTIGDIISNQNRTNHLSYWANRQVIEQMAADGSLDNIPPDKLDTVVREITEASDLATANKKFFPSRYLNPDDTYNATRESARTWRKQPKRKT